MFLDVSFARDIGHSQSPADVQDEKDVLRLEYITYIGSSFSVLFTAITIMLFLIQRYEGDLIILTLFVIFIFLIHS